MKVERLLRYLASLLASYLVQNVCQETEAIVGGHYAEDGQFAYHVSLKIFGKIICGGGIINERFVITTANCIIDASKKSLKNSSVKVIACVNDLKSTSRQKISVDVQEVFYPVEYNPRDELPIGDIAVLKLKHSLNCKQNSTMYQLKLPEDRILTYEGVEATITGFGWNFINYHYWPEINVIEEIDGHGDEKLRYAKALVASNNYAQLWETLQLNDKHLCAYLEQNDPDTATGVCTGDIGGPLVYNNTLIGVLSKRHDGCREDEQSAVYTRVSSYTKFISNIINNNEVISGVRRITFQ